MTTPELNFRDIIQLKTTRNIRFLSAPPGYTADPSGYWVVNGFVGTDVVASKEGATVRVPVADVRKVGAYTVDRLMEELHRLGRPDRTIDLVRCISEDMGWRSDKTRAFMVRLNLPLKAESEIHQRNIIEFVRKRAEELGEG